MSNAIDRLRQLLTPAIAGPSVDAVLEALALGDDLNDSNIEAVHDQLYIIKASGGYLDRVAANVGFVRPINVGISDDAFRSLAILTTAHKQITSVLLEVLEVFYGPDVVRAMETSTAAEPYALADGMQLILEFDSQDEITVTFSSNQFNNIAAATAQEVGDAITQQLRRLAPRPFFGAYGVDYRREDLGQTFVRLHSGTRGPLSAVRVRGGEAQNVLRFPTELATTQDIGTQWTITNPAGSTFRFTWTGGVNPSLGVVQADDVVTLYGSPLDPTNVGTFVVTKVEDGTVGLAYFEVSNILGTSQVVTQLTRDDVLFWSPTKYTIASLQRFATVFEVAPNVIHVFLPSTSQIVERQLIGAAHIHELVSSGDYNGPYIYDETVAGVLTEYESTTTTLIEQGQPYRAIGIVDPSVFPDESGYLMFGFGTESEEGPVEYVRRNGNLLLMSPSYIFRHSHPVGSSVTLLSSRGAIDLIETGDQYPFYLTGISPGRIYCESLVRELVATGLTLIVTILYPGDVGLGNAGWPVVGSKVSDIVRIFGGDQ